MLDIKSIRKVKEQENDIIIEWNLSTHCNYSCSYCSTYDNTGVGFPNDYKPFINFLNKVKNKYPKARIMLSIVGGEPTLWKLFNKFCEECSKLDILINITTNGSASIEFWKENIKYNIKYSISIHQEYFNKNNFYKILKILTFTKPKYNINLLMMMKLEDFDNNIQLAKDLVKEFNYLDINIKPLRDDNLNKTLNYTKEQKKELKVNYRSSVMIDEINPMNTKKLIINDNITNYNRHDILINKENLFTGWTCNAGLEVFYIVPEGDVFRCTKRVKGSIGNIFNGNVVLPNSPVICDFGKYCGCSHEISITKWRN